MKKIIFLLVAVASVSFANAQKIAEKDVPANVKSSLKKQYPNAKEVKWEKESGNFEAGFELKEVDYSVLLNASGNIHGIEKNNSERQWIDILQRDRFAKYNGY
ncbi:hypothetical protein [Sphingobacterium hungaricum]